MSWMSWWSSESRDAALCGFLPRSRRLVCLAVQSMCSFLERHFGVFLLLGFTTRFSGISLMLLQLGWVAGIQSICFH